MVRACRWTLIRSVLAVAVALCLVIAVALTTDVDRQISNFFFDPVSGLWQVDHDASHLRLWFYDGPKALIIVFGLMLLTIIVRPGLLPGNWFTRREALLVFLCLALVPLTVAVIKKNSNVQCPIVLQQYGGTQSNESGHVSLAGFIDSARPGGCWPSGHASGGFALLCLAWLNRRRRTRQAFALLGVGAGLAMGLYQLARGAHFASHVVVTSLIAVLVIVVVAKAFGIEND